MCVSITRKTNRYPQPIINHSTIFKTFDSKIDKWTSKIGVFGKSFNELGIAVNNAFEAVWESAINNSDENIGFWESLKNNLFSKKGDKDWVKNSLEEIISQENIDSYIEELDLDSAKEKLQGIFDWDTSIKNQETTWEKFFDTCKGGNEYLIDLIKNTNDLSKLTGEDLVNACNNAREAVIAHNEEIKNMSFSAKAGKVALNALAAVGNMFIGWAISKAIELVIQGITKLINYQDDLIEKSKEAIKAFKEAGDSLRSNKKTIEDITSDYTKLSQGVDSLGRNVSLNTEEYSRYNDIVNKIADMFPQMVQGYTDEGNAIIANKGNVEELTKAYEEQKRAYQDLIITKSAETYAGYKAQVVETPWTESIKGKHGTYSYIEQKEAIDDLIEALGKGKEAFEDFYSNSYIGTASNGMDYYSILQSALGEIGFDFGGVMNVDERFEKWKSQLETKIVSYQRDLINKINAETAQVKPILTAFIEQSSDYQNLNPKIQDTVKQIVNQFDYEFYKKFDNEVEMASWVTENLINKLQGVDGEKIAEAFNDAIDLKTKLQNGEVPVEEYLSGISKFKTLIDGFDDYTKKSVDLIFSVNSSSDLSIDTMINNVKNKLKDEFSDKVGELSLPELQIASEKITVSDGTPLSWNELKQKIQKFQDESERASNSIQNLSEAFEKLYDAIDDVLSKQEKLADAFKKTRLGAKLTIQEIYELIKEMPSLAPYVSKEDDGYTISAEGFEAVSKDNDNTIKEQIEKDIETTRENIALLEKEQELLAEKDKLYQQWENTGGANKNLKNQYDEVAAEYEEVAGQCQNITGSIEDLTEYEKSLVIINDLVGESFNEMSLIVEGVNEAFDKAKTEISGYNSNIQTIDNAIKTLKDGSLLSYDEMNSLLDISPQLHFDDIDDDRYSIAIEALEELREESYKTRNDYIDDLIAETKAEIEAAENTKKVIQDKINEINSLGKSAVLANAEYIATLNGEISELDKQSQPLYDIIKKLEGLKGNITTDDGGDDLSDKLQNQIDHYKTILSAVDAVQNKYSEAIDREISALEDSKKALRDSNDERQRELDLIDARNNLENAKKRKIWVYNEGEGFKQVANEKAVKEAEEDLRNVVVDIQEAEIDKRIEALEDQKEQLEENTKALVDLESEIEDAKNIAQAVNALGLSDESELLTLPDDTVEEIRDGLAEATLQKDIEDNKDNDDYVIVTFDELLKNMGAKVNAEEAIKILRGEDSQRMAYEAATKNYADALNGYENGSIVNNGGMTVTNYNTFEIYDATDPDKVARVVNQEMTNLFTKIGNSIK